VTRLSPGDKLILTLPTDTTRDKADKLCEDIFTAAPELRDRIIVIVGAQAHVLPSRPCISITVPRWLAWVLRAAGARDGDD